MVEKYILNQHTVDHLDQINYSLGYQNLKLKNKNKKLQKLKQTVFQSLGLDPNNISKLCELTIIDRRFDELYTENFNPDTPPDVIYIPSRRLMRQIIIDTVFEM